MKKIVFTLAIVITSAALGFSQNALRCNSPISNLVFQQKVNEINMQRVELRKLQVAKEIATNNCLSSSQVRQIAQMFTDDFNRLDFSMAAYANVFDKDNFYEVYDAFERFSNVFRLHDYTLAYQPLPPKSHTHQPAQPADVVMEIIFPEYNYPVCLHYSGMTGCNPPIRDNELRQLAGQLRNQPSEATKMAIATQLVLNNCLTTEHVMKLASMLENESQRLNFLKQSFPHVYDQQNYMAGEQLFSNEGLRQAFIAFVNSKLVVCLLYTSPSPRDEKVSRMPSSA